LWRVESDSLPFAETVILIQLQMECLLPLLRLAVPKINTLTKKFAGSLPAQKVNILYIEINFGKATATEQNQMSV
jgi:hypothetical protein